MEVSYFLSSFFPLVITSPFCPFVRRPPRSKYVSLSVGETMVVMEVEASVWRVILTHCCFTNLNPMEPCAGWSRAMLWVTLTPPVREGKT